MIYRCSVSALLLLAIVMLPGCGGKRLIDYKPSAQSGRQALESALKAWQSGAAYEPITSVKPAVSVFEARWRDGAKLESFEILEEVPSGEHVIYKVKLKLTGAPEATTTYRIVGIDPLNVWGEADYAQATGEGAAPPPGAPAANTPPPAYE
jgi:hypothetical protein